MQNLPPCRPSPWNGSAESISPNGRYRAIIDEAVEIGMGAPTSGTLVVSDNFDGGHIYCTLVSCSPSFVWSSDSQAIAVPQWTANRQQHLCIVSIPSGMVRPVAGEFRVMELHAFAQGIVQGVDSPIYMPQSFEISVEDWMEPNTITTQPPEHDEI
jgi:hypothetical protein